MALQKGEKAPDFTLKRKTAEGLEDVSLSGNIGTRQTVLLFFPLAFTEVCTNEMCDVSENLGEYDSLEASVYAISVDSPFTQEGWAQANGISLPILSDFNQSRHSPRAWRSPSSTAGPSRS